MPILDLISQIESGKPAFSPAPPARNTLLPKRKADDDARNGSSKAPRTTGFNPSSTSPPARPSTSSNSALSRPPPAGEKRTVVPQRPLAGQKYAPEKSSLLLNSVISGRITKPSGPAKPSSSSAASGARTGPKAPPKGSYLEIMARAQKAQEMMGPVGKIQHKPIEWGARKDAKDAKDEPAKEPTSNRKGSGSAPPTLKRGGTVAAAPGSRNSTALNPTKNGRNVVEARGGKTEKKTAAEPEKKVSKAVTATTGYTGTARPKPGAASKFKRPDASAAARAGLVSHPVSRSAKPPGRSRYYDDDDEDDDLDDFIEYDDEEPCDRSRRYDYNSDGSSDMEAGLDAIDYEERNAERLAKAEDKRAEQEERRLRLEKQKRKKRALEASRARS